MDERAFSWKKGFYRIPREFLGSMRGCNESNELILLAYYTMERFKNIAWSLFEIAETLVISLVAVFLVRSFVAQPFLVSGSSMEPGFTNGNYLLVYELTYHFRNPERGEVVVFKYPKDPGSFFIKRIIGLPGETVEMTADRLTIE